MIKIDLSIEPSLARAMADLVQTVRENLGKNLAIHPPFPDDDPDLVEAWKDVLVQSLAQDCQFLLSTLQREDFGQGELTLEETTAEGLLRACSAIRLKLRETTLQDVTDEELENGAVNPSHLFFEQQKSYLCYLFLAALQSEILLELDPYCEDF